MSTKREAAAATPELGKNEQPSTMNPAKKLTGWRLFLTLPCVLLGLFLATMDSSIVSTALVTIGNDFDNFIQTIWIVLGYLISYMTFSLLWPRVSDLVGRKWSFILSSLLLLAFSVGCALSQTLEQLIAFRVLQGLGGSGMYSLGNMILPEIAPNKWYSYMLAAQGTILTLAGVLGPLFGGIIATRTTWRWIFWLNIPICAAIAGILAVSWTDNTHQDPFWTRFQHVRKYDFVGLLLFTAATCLLVLGLEIGGSSFAKWNSAEVIVLLCSFVVCTFVFVGWNMYRENASAKTQIRALFPASLFHMRLIIAALLICTLGGFNLFVVIVNLPQRFQVVNKDSTLTAGVRLTPFLTASAVGSTISGIICAQKNYTFHIVLTACCFVIVGSCLLMQLPRGTEIYIGVYGFQVLSGLGTGGILSSTGYITGINSKYEDYAISSGITSQARIFGGCLGLTLSNLILNETFTKTLGAVLTRNELKSLRQSLEFSKTLTVSQQKAISDAFAEAFHWQFVMAACIGAVGALISFACWTRHPIDLKQRLAIGERISRHEITPEEGDRLLRSSLSSPDV